MAAVLAAISNPLSIRTDGMVKYSGRFALSAPLCGRRRPVTDILGSQACRERSRYPQTTLLTAIFYLIFETWLCG